ncbi:MAG TPA: hypothetical protein VGC53_06885 [Vicinamibacteria bacterium]
MSIRRLNYTGRKRIRQTDCQINLEAEEGGVSRFRADIRLDGYELPPNALVFVEAYRQTSWMRFRFGTVGQIRPWDEPRLIDFSSSEGVLFRVRVTSQFAPRGVLLAEADRIRPRRADREDEDREPLLPARPVENLGAQIYKVDFQYEPILLINKDVGDWQGLTQDRTFQALALPVVLREILTRILHIEKYTELDDEVDWKSKWLRLATRLPGVTDPPLEGEGDRIDDWIDDAVASFSRKFKIMERFSHYWTGERET